MSNAKPLSKGQVIAALCEKLDKPKKEVVAFLDALTGLITDNLKKGPGVFALPGVAKFKTIKKPATKERKGKNPFTGEEQIFKAKPASKAVRIRPLKALKDSI